MSALVMVGEKEGGMATRPDEPDVRVVTFRVTTSPYVRPRSPLLYFLVGAFFLGSANTDVEEEN